MESCYLASGPLAWSTTFVAPFDFFFDLIPEFRVGVLIFWRHLELRNRMKYEEENEANDVILFDEKWHNSRAV